MLRHLKRVFIQFSPTDPRATAARELLQRVGCEAARSSNPDCEVEFKVDEGTAAGQAVVELHFNDGQQAKLLAAGAWPPGAGALLQAAPWTPACCGCMPSSCWLGWAAAG
jgi:hypothetical protein